MYTLSEKKYLFLSKMAIKTRKQILDISYNSGVGHIAPALCVVDILTVLYHYILNLTPQKMNDPYRNRFILSKGHAAAALYVSLYQKKFFTKKQLNSYCQDASEFGVHPDFNPKFGIELTTGSLGHGLPIGAGMALGLKKITAYKLHKPLPHVYVLISDAELNEGSVWETIMFAGHHKISNLTVIIDNNGNQAFGKTKDILNLNPLKNKFASFGWSTKQIDGHNIKAVVNSLAASQESKDKPTAIIAHTHSGYGVDFMKDKIEWHYLPLSKDTYTQALRDINKENSI
jgi:transketolase